MTDTNLLLLNLINQGFSNDAICNKMQISKKQLRQRIENLKNDGYNLKRIFHHNGSQGYFVDHNILDCDAIIDKIKGERFRAMAISDTHFGHEKANLNYINYIYDYCTRNNIHIIFHAGDLLQGNIRPFRLCPEKQLEYVIDNYPFERSIINIIAPGNHDNTFIKDFGINIKPIIESNRSDLVIVRPGEASIKVDKDYIHISHERSFTNQECLRIGGHSHFFKYISSDCCPMVTVPTLSDLLYDSSSVPGAVQIEMSMADGFFKKLYLTQLIFDDNYKIKRIGKINSRF